MIPRVGEAVEPPECSFTAGGNADGTPALEGSAVYVKLKKHLLYGPAPPLLGTVPREATVYVCTCT